MAQEIKNTFLKAKMNKDLDDRVIPNGEYRDALNVSVGKSEADNVGSLENILGNVLLGQTYLGDGYEIIGFLEDSTNDKIYTFVTNYTDINPDSPTDAPPSSEHYIYVYDAATDADIDSGKKAAGFEDLDGDGNELIDDAIITDEEEQ